MVKKEIIIINSPIDNLAIHGFVYTGENVKGIVQIFHGMAEHKERYEELCVLLAKMGYAAIICDHRGHGETITQEVPKGFFTAKNGWKNNLDDLHLFTKEIKTRFPNVPFYILGHSMGSLFAQSYLKKYEYELNGVILSGVPAYNPACRVGKIMADACSVGKNMFGHNNTIASMVNTYNKSFKNPRTEFDWLSYNTLNVDKYIADDLCGFNFTNKGYADLMDGLIDVNCSEDWIAKNKSLPILCVIGKDDPCANYPKGFQHSLDNLYKKGYSNVEAHVYDNMRHEIFNETDNKTVYKDILTWLVEK